VKLAGKKVAVWIKNGRRVKHTLVNQSEKTLPEPGMPVFIVSFDANGKIMQADVHTAEGDTIIVTADIGVEFGPKRETCFLTRARA
jgi:hypothetical protein